MLEGKLAWFVYMIGAIVKGRLTTGSTDTQELLDGDLATRALSLLEVADSEFHQPRYADESRQRLDVALLTFFQHFRKVRLPDTPGLHGRQQSWACVPFNSPIMFCDQSDRSSTMLAKSCFIEAVTVRADTCPKLLAASCNQAIPDRLQLVTCASA